MYIVTLYVVHSFIVHCKFVHCTLYIVHCALSILHCTIYVVHFTTYIVHTHCIQGLFSGYIMTFLHGVRVTVFSRQCITEIAAKYFHLPIHHLPLVRILSVKHHDFKTFINKSLFFLNSFTHFDFMLVVNLFLLTIIFDVYVLHSFLLSLFMSLVFSFFFFSFVCFSLHYQNREKTYILYLNLLSTACACLYDAIYVLAKLLFVYYFLAMWLLTWKYGVPSVLLIVVAHRRVPHGGGRPRFEPGTSSPTALLAQPLSTE